MDLLPRSFWNGTLDLPIMLMSRGYRTLVDQPTALGAHKYLNGLTGMPADSNLRKLTASHCNFLITQIANENMSNMFLIVYLSENLRYCNENLAWGK